MPASQNLKLPGSSMDKYEKWTERVYAIAATLKQLLFLGS
jgi:hypothetical protein